MPVWPIVEAVGGQIQNAAPYVTGGALIEAGRRVGNAVIDAAGNVASDVGGALADVFELPIGRQRRGSV